MIDIHNNELFSICHFARLALNPTRSGRLLPYVRMCVCMCIHTHVCRYVYRRTDVHTGVVIGAELWVSSIYIRTRTHILMWVTRAGITHMHTYVYTYARHMYVRLKASSLKYAIKNTQQVSDTPIFHSIFFCLLSPHDTDKCMRWPWRASMRCDLLFRTRHTYIRTADKICYVHMHRCMFLGACMYARDVRTYDCSMTLTADDAN